jgi:hypothetical protein
MTAALLALLLVQEPKHPWAGFKEGSEVVYDISERERAVETTMTRRVTVVKVEKAKATLKEEDTDNEGKAAGSRDVTVSLAAPAGLASKGKEEVTVDGRKITCDVFVIGETPARKLWLAKESLTGIVKEERTWEAEGKKCSIVSTLAKIGEIVDLGAKVTCAVFDVVEDYGDRKVTRREWRSPEVPGQIVKSEEKDGTRTRIVEVTRFKKK